MSTIKRVLITAPNTSWDNKRSWIVPPYTLALLAAIVPKRYEIKVVDPNLDDLTHEQLAAEIKAFDPDVVGVTCLSLEYAPAVHKIAEIVKTRTGRDRIVVFGGVYVTTTPELVMKDHHIDFAVLGEGERRLPRLLQMLEEGATDFSGFDGLGYRQGGQAAINPARDFMADLDETPFPNYGAIDFPRYFNTNHKFANVMNVRYMPYAMMVTSRGCPYLCIYCSTHSIDGKKVRWRSVDNVMSEIDYLVGTHGIREILFLDDQLILNRPRFWALMEAFKQRKYDLHWKSVNLATFLLKPEMLDVMRETGAYQLILPIESGNQYVLDNILKKPLDLTKVPPLIKRARELDFEISRDFIIGSPGETWSQIRDSFRFADEIDVDMVSFHIATPLPKTELYHLALKGGYLEEGFEFTSEKMFGFGKGVLSSDEFTPAQLQMLRALEWDRINFKTPAKCERFARMAGVTLAELEDWRRNTIKNLGVYFPGAETASPKAKPASHASDSNALLDRNGRFAKLVNMPA